MVRWEAVITAQLGCGAGIVIGVILGWAAVTALRSEGFTRFAMSLTTIGVVLLVAAVGRVVAAARPARRAARLEVLSAISSE